MRQAIMSSRIGLCLCEIVIVVAQLDVSAHEEDQGIGDVAVVALIGHANERLQCALSEDVDLPFEIGLKEADITEQKNTQLGAFRLEDDGDVRVRFAVSVVASVGEYDFQGRSLAASYFVEGVSQNTLQRETVINSFSRCIDFYVGRWSGSIP